MARSVHDVDDFEISDLGKPKVDMLKDFTMTLPIK